MDNVQFGRIVYISAKGNAIGSQMDFMNEQNKATKFEM